MNTNRITRNELAGMIDHAVLRPQTTPADLHAACEVATRYRVACLCVRPADVAQAVTILTGSGVTAGTVVSFPHGSCAPATKAAETRRAIEEGAGELDMVLNIGRLIGGDVNYVRDEIAVVVESAGGRIVKVIFENHYLTDEQIAAACRASVEAGASFVKTSTGFAPTGAAVADVRLMREQVGESVGVKAAGGIRTLADALAMIDAGATRIGTSGTQAILAEL